MFGLFIILISTITIIASLYWLVSFLNRKRREFVSQHSVAINGLRAINLNYAFRNVVNPHDEYTYDNEIYYDNVSCCDYLIYQLQFRKKSIPGLIEDIEYNRELYNKYVEDKQSVSFGVYDVPVNKYLIELLNNEERRQFDEVQLKPVAEFKYSIKLRLTNINGVEREEKSENFTKNVVLSLIGRIENKTNGFYNDRDIWDAITRVERGKVSNKMRFAIMKRDGYRCKICGRREGYNCPLEIDHIIPIAKGGKSTFNNLQTLCHNCNVQKGDSWPY